VLLLLLLLLLLSPPAVWVVVVARAVLGASCCGSCCNPMMSAFALLKNLARSAISSSLLSSCVACRGANNLLAEPACIQNGIQVLL
jgi:hypothetical protein